MSSSKTQPKLASCVPNRVSGAASAAVTPAKQVKSSRSALPPAQADSLKVSRRGLSTRPTALKSQDSLRVIPSRNPLKAPSENTIKPNPPQFDKKVLGDRHLSTTNTSLRVKTSLNAGSEGEIDRESPVITRKAPNFSELSAETLRKSLTSLHGISETSGCVPCHSCCLKMAILCCMDCDKVFCALCFGESHLEPKKMKHKTASIFALVDKANPRPEEKLNNVPTRGTLKSSSAKLHANWPTKSPSPGAAAAVPAKSHLIPSEAASISAEKKSRVHSSKINKSMTPAGPVAVVSSSASSAAFIATAVTPSLQSTSSLFSGDFDEEGARKDFLAALDAFRSQSKVGATTLESRHLGQVWKPELSHVLPPPSASPSANRSGALAVVPGASSLYTQTEPGGGSVIRKQADKLPVLSSTSLNLAEESRRLTSLLRETQQQLEYIVSPNPVVASFPAPQHTKSIVLSQNGRSFSSSGALCTGSVDGNDVDSRDSHPESVALHRQKISNLLKFAGVPRKPDRPPRPTVLTCPSRESNPTRSLSPKCSRSLTIPGPIKPANYHTTTVIVTPRSPTSRTPVTPQRTFRPTAVSNSSDAMQIHRPLQFALSTRMLDIDLPRISITTSSDNYTTNRSGKTLLLPGMSDASNRGSGGSPRHSTTLLPTSAASCAVSHLSASFVTQPRSRSPSLRSRSPSPSPRPVIVPPPASRASPVVPTMAVLSRTPVVRKSPSMTTATTITAATIASAMRSGASSRSSSAERSSSVIMTTRRSPSPVPAVKSGSSGSLNKLSLPSPVIVRRHSTKTPLMSARSGDSPPPTRKMTTAVRGPTVVPRRKSPVIAGRNRSFTVSSAGSGSGGVVEGAQVSTHQPTDQQQHKSKYERNLKKFYTWCAHCRRVQRVPPSDSTKGVPTATSSTTGGKGPSASNRVRLSQPNVKASLLHMPQQPVSRSPKKPLIRNNGLFSFESSDLPLTRNSVMQRNSEAPYLGSLQPDVLLKERPKSARTASVSDPIVIDKPKFQSLFDFDDALSLTPDQVDMTWMLDPLDSDDDFYCYDLDVETMSVCSDSSIVAMAITCDTKLKDDDDEFAKAPLRKTLSSHQ